MRFKLDVKGDPPEVSGAYPNGESYLVKFNANGTANVTDEAISADLERLSDDSTNPVSRVKGK